MGNGIGSGRQEERLAFHFKPLCIFKIFVSMYTYYSYNKSKIKAFLLRKEYLPFWGRINIIFRIFATLYFYGYVFKQSIIGLSSDYPIS